MHNVIYVQVIMPSAAHKTGSKYEDVSIQWGKETKNYGKFGRC